MSTPRAIRLILVPVDIVFFIVQIAREGTIGRLSNKPVRDCQKDWVDFLPKKKQISPTTKTGCPAKWNQPF
jgi:hypothetical protein